MWSSIWQDLRCAVRAPAPAAGLHAHRLAHARGRPRIQHRAVCGGSQRAAAAASLSATRPHHDAVDGPQPGRHRRRELLRRLPLLEGTESHSFESLATYNMSFGTLTDAGDPEEIGGSTVSPEFFKLLGVKLTLGRGIEPGDELISPDAGRPIAIAFGLWQRRFNGDPQIVGKTLTIGGRAADDRRRRRAGVRPARAVLGRARAVLDAADGGRRHAHRARQPLPARDRPTRARRRPRAARKRRWIRSAGS